MLFLLLLILATKTRFMLPLLTNSIRIVEIDKFARPVLTHFFSSSFLEGSEPGAEPTLTASRQCLVAVETWLLT